MPGDYATIQEAMDAASAGDTVFVSPGTYTGVNEFELESTGFIVKAVVIMKPGVTLLGLPDAAESVVIQGSDSTAGIFIHDADSTTAVIGVTVTGATAGIAGMDASPVISDCRLVANGSTDRPGLGGGMKGDDFSPTVTDCLFADNLAAWGGGAGFSDQSYPFFARCAFTGNHAVEHGEDSGRGGAIHLYRYSQAGLVDCSLTNNTADAEGGGVYVTEYAVIVATDSQIRDNEAEAGADGYLGTGAELPYVVLRCCDIDPQAWVGDDLVLEDNDCD